MHKEYRALNIVAVQRWIAAGRYDPTETLTIQKVSQTGMLGGLHKYNGVKLCGYASEEYGPLPPLTVHLSRFSKNAAEAITSAGGTCVSVYHNELGLRQELYPRRFEGAKAVKSAGPTRKKDIGQSIRRALRSRRVLTSRRILHQPGELWLSLGSRDQGGILQEQRMEPGHQARPIYGCNEDRRVAARGSLYPWAQASGALRRAIGTCYRDGVIAQGL